MNTDDVLMSDCIFRYNRFIMDVNVSKESINQVLAGPSMESKRVPFKFLEGFVTSIKLIYLVSNIATSL